MANHKSAKTRIRRNDKRSMINGMRRSRVRTFVKKVDALINAKDKEAAAAAFITAESEMMRVRNLGRKSLDEVIQKLHSLGLELKKSEE